ncbi:MAG: hypothetical protein AAF591_01885 [Verrucomicrobiota bacterium]
MQTSTRSPRFPFIPLQRALKHTLTLQQHFKTAATPAPKAMKALGFDTMSGKANKIIAALRAYGLITVDHQRKVRRIAVTPAGARLAKNPGAQKLLNPLRLAALAPTPFRRLWENRPGITEEKLAATLKKRNFTEQGADRAAKVYMANVRFAQLEDADFRASNNLPPAPAPQTVTIPARPPRLRQGAATKPGQKLQVPLGKNFAAIPTNLSEAHFKLLMQTLRIWKPTLTGTLK